MSCCFSWVVDKQILIRLLDFWPSIVKMVNHLESLPKWKILSFKSCQNLTAVNANLIPAKLQPFSFTASLFELFSLKYQSFHPMLPFLHDDLLKLVKKVPLLIIKPNLVLTCSTMTELKKIKLTNEDNFLKVKEISHGFCIRKCITGLKKFDFGFNKRPCCIYK